MFLRNARICGFAASPMTRICSLDGPTNVVTTTVTTGSRMYLPSAFSISRASWVGDLPSAGRSSTSGVVTLPSGRTGTDIDSSGLRQTMMLTVSSDPITYS